MSDGLNIGIRQFELDRDLDDVKRIWQEVGWVEDEDEITQLDHFFAEGETLLGTINDVAECSVHTTPGEVCLGSSALSLCAVTAVTTSRIARGYAFAQRVTAKQLARAAQNGAAVAALGIFDQGFYDKLGFGTGAYDHRFCFDPGTLKVDQKPRTPVRLGVEDFVDVHRAMCDRHKVHGSVSLNTPKVMQAELGWGENAFGLGYRENGTLTHFIWLEPKGERGPYRAQFVAYRTMEQLLELLALLKSLADQVYSVKLMQPPEIQLQVLLDRPFRNSSMSKGSVHQADHEAFAWWQMRVLDVPACVGAIVSRESASFTLRVSDPLEKHLSDEQWQGVGGLYRVSIGPQSSAQRVSSVDEGMPVLECSVNSFTRWAWGVAPASSLAVTDDFVAEQQLLDLLDQVIEHRDPNFGWDF